MAVGFGTLRYCLFCFCWNTSSKQTPTPGAVLSWALRLTSGVSEFRAILARSSIATTILSPHPFSEKRASPVPILHLGLPVRSYATAACSFWQMCGSWTGCCITQKTLNPKLVWSSCTPTGAVYGLCLCSAWQEVHDLPIAARNLCSVKVVFLNSAKRVSVWASAVRVY